MPLYKGSWKSAPLFGHMDACQYRAYVVIRHCWEYFGIYVDIRSCLVSANVPEFARSSGQYVDGATYGLCYFRHYCPNFKWNSSWECSGIWAIIYNFKSQPTVGNVSQFAPSSGRWCAILGTFLFPSLLGVFWNLCHYLKMLYVDTGNIDVFAIVRSIWDLSFICALLEFFMNETLLFLGIVGKILE